LLFAALLGACDSPRKPLEARDLKIAAQEIESIAAEAGWLARELGDGDVTQSLAWVHQQALGEDAGKAVQDLAKFAPPQLRDGQAQVLALSARLKAQVGRIAPAANRADELASLRGEFEAIAHAAHPYAEAE
jgi:hypothetical protein